MFVGIEIGIEIDIESGIDTDPFGGDEGRGPHASMQSALCAHNHTSIT